jgi:hypothetical protein
MMRRLHAEGYRDVYGSNAFSTQKASAEQHANIRIMLAHHRPACPDHPLHGTLSPSWPGLSRPSSSPAQNDARDKPAHDEHSKW